jgi:DDE superfamily endonuclease
MRKSPRRSAKWSPDRRDVLLRHEASSLGHHAGTIWAPVGHTSVVRTPDALLGQYDLCGGHHRIVNTTSRLTPGRRHIHPLLRQTAVRHRRPVFLLVDGHFVHRSRAVTDYTAGTNGRLRLLRDCSATAPRLLRLPSYSPELNPDKWVWKTSTRRHRPVTPPPARRLHHQNITALERPTRLPQLIRAFSVDPQPALHHRMSHSQRMASFRSL